MPAALSGKGHNLNLEVVKNSSNTFLTFNDDDLNIRLTIVRLAKAVTSHSR